ncbi:hypothetical protein [Thiothrix winogradskyi]
MSVGVSSVKVGSLIMASS